MFVCGSALLQPAVFVSPLSTFLIDVADVMLFRLFVGLNLANLMAFWALPGTTFYMHATNYLYMFPFFSLVLLFTFVSLMKCPLVLLFLFLKVSITVSANYHGIARSSVFNELLDLITFMIMRSFIMHEVVILGSVGQSLNLINHTVNNNKLI